MEKNHPFYQKSMEKNFLGLPHLMCFADSSNSMEKPVHFPSNEIYHRMRSNRKNHPYYGKSMSTDSPASPHTISVVGH